MMIPQIRHGSTTILLALFVLLVLFKDGAMGQAEQIKWKITGFFKNETSWRTNSPNELMEMTNIFQIETNYYLTQNIEFYFEGRGFWDGSLDLQDKGWTRNKFLRTRLSKPLSHTQMDPVREFWADMNLGKLQMRFGKQQIVWGNTEGLKMLDIINPTDLREFSQDAFEESRISLWAAKIEYLVTGDSTLQFVWTPDVEPNFGPLMFSPYNIEIARQSEPAVKLNIIKFITDHVGRSFRNSDWGFRWKQNFGLFEYTLNYWNAWTDYPGVYFAGIIPNPASPTGSTIILEKKYKQKQSIGGSFSQTITQLGPLYNFVIRAECVYDLKDIGTIRTPFGLAQNRSDDFNYAIAVDKSWYPWFARSGINCEFQFFQTITFAFDDKFVNGLTGGPWDKYENTFSLFAWTDYYHEKIKPELLVVYGYNHKDCWVRPRISYEINTIWHVTLGGNIYWGHRNTTWGEFRDNDQIGLEIKYSF